MIFLLRLFSLSWKSVFVIKFACFNLAGTSSAVSLLNSGVVIYLSWLWSLIFFSMLLNFGLQAVFLTRLLTSGILFWTAVNPVFVAKALKYRILPSVSVIFVFLARSAKWGFFFLFWFICVGFSF